MIADKLRTKLYCTGYSRKIETSADLRDLLSYAYRFRAELNAYIGDAEGDLVRLADTPDTIKRAMATLHERQ